MAKKIYAVDVNVHMTTRVRVEADSADEAEGLVSDMSELDIERLLDGQATVHDAYVTGTEGLEWLREVVTTTCRVCHLKVRQADPEDDESWVHDEDREFDDHSAEVD